MPDDRIEIEEKLLTALDELRKDESADVMTYVDHVKEEAKMRQGGSLWPGAMELIWRCTECGYLQTRVEQLPDQCPNCGAAKESFVLVEED